MQMTDIQLPLLNKKTLQQWYNKEDKEQEQKVLLQGINMPKPPMTASGLPEARQKPAVLPSSEAPRFTFQNPSCTAGLAHKRTNCKRKTPVPEPSDSKKPALQTIKPATPTIIRYPVMMEQQQLIVLNPGHHTFPSFTTSTPPTTTSTTPSKKSRPYKPPSFINFYAANVDLIGKILTLTNHSCSTSFVQILKQPHLKNGKTKRNKKWMKKEN
ncbi:uncharacterized protein LOC128547652 [Mercenaria mercenaria]|uniref:uncharacterized protein LOC128547652 n=1 Tax=Mercenaria mercenaria TaxID=6596 RepID=UPI00234E771C|nr:uncharacterized protein LOC128547652 [Mercenaria mercenaria]